MNIGVIKWIQRSLIIGLPKREERTNYSQELDIHKEINDSRLKVAALKQETEVVTKIEIPIPGLSTDMKDRSGKTENTYTRKDERADWTDVRAN